MFLRFDAGPFLSLSFFELMGGALSGGHCSVSRFTLLALFVLAVVGVLAGSILLIRTLTSRNQSRTSRI
jgi:hypothetical protein